MNTQVSQKSVVENMPEQRLRRASIRSKPLPQPVRDRIALSDFQSVEL